ncbi:MAG: adenylate cyclase [Desulfobacterales bacterium RIFOXYA12_FULL_46_15]|nr:MAG: adenylate cyclase [Desulfobacula sp. GWF2_41_7]OGR27371.1 MAG: adenylate cyclase [Desulfobacterales bacterium RIFOXYA12_FULL_46_15]
MGVEIERKFLLKGDRWRSLGHPVRYCQGYLNRSKERTVRVRMEGEKGYLAIKGISRGVKRIEYEYEIPEADCRAMLNGLVEKPVIEKNRTRIEYKGMVFEIDEFFGENQGLIIAEVELESEDQTIELPDWIGREVTHDPRYYNSNLVLYPYTKWSQK